MVVLRRSTQSKREREGGKKITVYLRDVIFDYDWLIATQLFNVFIKQKRAKEMNGGRRKRRAKTIVFDTGK